MPDSNSNSAIDQAIADRDAPALLAALDTAHTLPPAASFTKGLTLLLARGGFDAFLAGVKSPLADPAAAHRVINSRVRRLTGEQLAQFAAAAGAPQPDSPRTQLLAATLIHSPDPRITAALLIFIRAHHAATADDLAIADAIATLARRAGSDAADALITLLHDTPYDTYASAALLEGLLHHRDDRCRPAIAAALLHHAAPPPFRLMLLAAQHTFQPEAAIERLMQDLRLPMSLNQYSDTLQLLNTWLQKSPELPPSAVSALRDLAPADWPRPIRVALLLILRRTPHAKVLRVSPADRALATLVASFERLRLRAAHSFWLLPLLFLALILLSAALNLLLATPTPTLQPLNGLLILVWFFTLLITSRTPLAAQVTERPARLLTRALLFWLATLLLFASLVGTRLYTHFTP